MGRLLLPAVKPSPNLEIAARMNGLLRGQNKESVNRMSSRKANNGRRNEVVLIVLLIYGFIFAWIMAFSESVPYLDCDKHVIDYRDKLVVLIIASMTAAATLLTTTPEDNRTKQLSFLLIAVTGVVAATVAIPPRSWGLLICLAAGLLPVVLAFFFVFWRLFKRSRWAYLLLAVGAVLVWAAAFLLHSNLGMSIPNQIGNPAFYALIIGLTFKGFVLACAGWCWFQSNERRTSRQTSGSDG